MFTWEEEELLAEKREDAQIDVGWAVEDGRFGVARAHKGADDSGGVASAGSFARMYAADAEQWGRRCSGLAVRQGCRLDNLAFMSPVHPGIAGIVFSA